MQNQTKDAFNHHVVTYARVYFDHNELGSDLMGDPADSEEKTFAELGLADVDALHDYVRSNKTLNAYEIFKVYYAEIDGHKLNSAKIPLGGKTYFSALQLADNTEIVEPSKLIKPREEQRRTRYVDVYPQHKGRAFAMPGMQLILLEDGDKVFDRASGACLWDSAPTGISPQRQADPSP